MGKTMIANYKRYHSSRLSDSGSPAFALTAVMTVCIGLFVMCGCGESSATVVATRHAGVEVLMLPILRGGAAGWCVTEAAGAGCQISRLKHGPIVGEFWIAEPTKERAQGYALTMPNVAAVTVNGSRSIETLREPGLPEGWRAVAVKIEGEWAPKVKMPGLLGNPPYEAPARLPMFTPLDIAGNSLAQNNEEGPFLEQEVAGRHWSRPATEPTGACELHSTRLQGLVTNAGFVVARAEPVNGLLGRPFLSCASNSYTLEGWPLVGSVLIDATRPGAAPPLLPAMKAIRGHRGAFSALGSNGPMVARHGAGGAWLVVSGGENKAQRLMLLKHLHATVHV
jgi:hypothetical protein